jgi:glycosyltransferase involved in cell wall biosynthesis
MADTYHMADIVLSVPSSEGYGATVYEALASGIPTIITDLPVFKSELQHEKHTLKVQVNEPDQISKAILRLLNDKNLRTSLVENGLETSRMRSATIRKKNVEGLYQIIFDLNYG